MNIKNIIHRFSITFTVLLLLAIVSACGKRVNVNEHTKGFEPVINYYHDCRTGLCFGEIVQGTQITGHVCVPCDSVKRFLEPCE